MLNVHDFSVSCGVKVIGGETTYQTAEAFVKDFFTIKQNRYFFYTQFIFTHCTSPTATNRGAQVQKDNRCMGDKIEEYVKTHNLGVITRSEPGSNPVHPETKEHPRKIVVWVWTIPDTIGANYLASLAKEKTEKKDA